jgi:hypothetical protein
VPVVVALRVRRERESNDERKRREGKRKFLNEKQKPEFYIFGGSDSDEKQQKLPQSAKSDEKLTEADSYGSYFKRSGPYDRGSDG